MRLQKYLAECGVASRRAAEAMIAAGRIQVNGNTITTPGTTVSPEDIVRVDGKPVSPPQTWRTIMLNKPPAVMTTLHDPQERRTVVDLVRAPERLFPVGRLDYMTEGLLLMTNDGELSNALTHPSREVDKRYTAWVRGEITDEILLAMRAGLLLGDGHRSAPADASRLPDGNAISLTVHEGHNRLIRRMCTAVGLRVIRLRREAIGPLTLGRLAPGEYRDLSHQELALLRKACGLADGRSTE